MRADWPLVKKNTWHICYTRMPETNITKSDEVEAGNVCTSATEREDIQLLVCMTKPTS